MEAVGKPSSAGLPGWKRVLSGRLTIALNVVLAVVVTAEIIIVGHLVYRRWDLTQDRTFTVSPRTTRFLRSLKEPVRVSVFYGKQYPPHAWAWQRIHDLLEEFQAHTKFLDVEFIDPFRAHSEAQQLRQKFGISPNDFNDGVVVIEYGEKFQYVADGRIVAYMRLPGAPAPDRKGKKTFHGEEALLSAMNALVEGRKPLALVLAGHGEARLEDAGTREGFNQAAMLLRGDGYDVRELRLGAGGTDGVPEDAEVVIVAYPKAPLANAEVHALTRYAERGGKLLLMPSLHWSYGEIKPIDMNLGPLLAHFEIELGDKGLVEDEHRGRRDIVMALPVLRYAADHPATRAMGEGEEKPCIFETVRVVRPVGKKAVPIVFSTPTTIEKGDLAEIQDRDRYRNLLRYRHSLFDPKKDKRGPFPLAVASEVPGKRPELTARAIVVGTQSFTSNQGLALPFFHKDLFLNMMNWLTRRESHMGIAAKHPRDVGYHVRPRVRKRVFLLVMVFMPLIAIMAGAAVWFSRRT